MPMHGPFSFSARRAHLSSCLTTSRLPLFLCLQANGELRLSCHTADSWHFPEFYGRVSVK